METAKLKKFAQFARRSLIEQVGSKLAQVLKEESSERRELPKVVAKLEGELKQKGKEQLIEQVAYVWFNRFCALRFMDVNGYNRIGVLSPAEGQFQPEILAEAKAGHIDEGVVNDAASEKIFGLLNGSIKSRDGQSEAYRLLIAAVCNDYHRIMPYLFERIEDYTELLMPDDLLSGNSILAYTREAMTPEACESVECIGWLYQFYISEKKDQVFEGLKKNKKITPENIPAATQLFTPHWIVRYLVENSLGRLWMLNNPSSKVIEKMDYYIKPVEGESEAPAADKVLKITSPEEIKVCDPACGSGHMLTYAYDMLYAIYLDAGYDPVDIPELILTKNLYGIEIDERAAELAAFALSMKALKGNPNDDSNNRRRFFRNPIKPNICRLESIAFNNDELDEYIEFVGRDLFTQDLRTTLKEFEEADNFGSLIQPTLKNAEDVSAVLEAKDVSGQLFLTEIHKRVLQVVDQADYLSQKYHIVVANPPYMEGRGMNAALSKFSKKNFPDAKTDAFTMFVQRIQSLTVSFGYISIVCPYVWMYISSYEAFRKALLRDGSITSLVQLEYNAFEPACVPVAAWNYCKNIFVSGTYIDLSDFKGHQNQAPRTLEAISDERLPYRYSSSSKDFALIPGSPIAYQASTSIKNAFPNFKRLGDLVDFTGSQNITGNNEEYLRFHWEIDCAKFGKGKTWVRYLKGGGFRKWNGLNLHAVNWSSTARNFYQSNTTSNLLSEDYWYRDGITYSELTSSANSFRFQSDDAIYDKKGPTFHGSEEILNGLLCLTNSKVAQKIFGLLNPTLSLQVRDVKNLPVKKIFADTIQTNAKQLINHTRLDWDSFEISWNFSMLPLLSNYIRREKLEDSYTNLLTHWQSITCEMQALEKENNSIFIDAYGLQDELTPEVPVEEITLTCNPAYRYGVKSTKDEREKRLLADTIAEFISYAVGCMFGRYSLDASGLVLASQGDTVEDYLNQVPKPSFMPDDDNVIPMIDFDGDWFEDDTSERFKEFLKVTFGEEHFAENLTFVEEAIGKDIKKYFAKDFYTDHVKRYKKRPIYWLFSSPKGTFNALIYMHRYRSDTVSVVLNDYLREFRTKLQARKESYEQIEVSASASQKEKTQAIKAIDKINKVLDEVNDYERDILYPLAGQNIEIDLDDGVKANYPKFGKALKKIAGLS